MLCAIYIAYIQTSYSQQINPSNITIVRDSFGVPHIYAATDAEAAYGLAWAHCEDNFHDIQLNGIGGRGRRGEVEGKEGVIFDFARKFLGIDTLVNNRYENDFSASFKKVLEAYTQGVNDYAYSHKDEMMLDDILPFTAHDIVNGYCITTTLLSGVGYAIQAIRSGEIELYIEPNQRGSNAMCISPSRTEDGKAWLLVNSHQPLEGPYAWYEAHIQSEEGWNVIGGLFPGGVSVFVGCNEHLGWAHTNNYHTFGDIYLLKTKGNSYLYDGTYVKFGSQRIPLKVKLGYLKLAVKKKVTYSEFGPVYKYKGKHYALRFPAYTNIKAAEQWFMMNKATNIKEFEACMKQDNLAMFNTLYADVEGNIYCHSAGMMPYRDTTLDWKNPIPGTSSKYKWNQLLPYEKKVTYLNPECGYLYNANNTPLNATGAHCTWNGCYFPGLQLFEFNRGERFKRLFEQLDGKKITWDDFRRIKFDKSFDSTGSYMNHFGVLYTLDEKKYPDIAPALYHLKNWNLESSTTNRSAALANTVHHFLCEKTGEPFGFLLVRNKQISESDAVWAIRKASHLLLKSHHLLNPPMGDVFRHIRGTVSLPASGTDEVLRAAGSYLYDKDKGIFRVNTGDGYMQMVKFSKEKGPEIFSITAYGSSSRPLSPNYTDQMKLYTNEQFKVMTFDKKYIFTHAIKIYKPGN